MVKFYLYCKKIPQTVKYSRKVGQNENIKEISKIIKRNWVNEIDNFENDAIIKHRYLASFGSKIAEMLNMVLA